MEIVKKNDLWVVSGPCHKKLVILLNMRLFGNVGGSRRFQINLKLKF